MISTVDFAISAGFSTTLSAALFEASQFHVPRRSTTSVMFVVFGVDMKTLASDFHGIEDVLVVSLRYMGVIL